MLRLKQQALSASRVGTWVRHVESNELIWDDQMYDLFGVGRDQFRPTVDDVLALIVPEDRNRILEVAAKALECGSSYNTEFRVTLPTGQLRYLESRGKAFPGKHPHTAGVCLDVTARRLEQEHLSKTAAIVESSNDGIIAKNLEGIILTWNHAAELIYGYSESEAVGRHISMLFPADRPNELARILEILNQGSRIHHFETVRVRKDGKLVDVDLTISPVRNPAGTIVGASTIVRDISDRKRRDRLFLAQYSITKILSECESIEEAAPQILMHLAESWNWPIATIFGIDSANDVMRCIDVYSCNESSKRAFTELSKRQVYPRAVGLPGRVWQNAMPFWVGRLQPEHLPFRMPVAEKAELSSAFAIPIKRGDHVLGVIELFSSDVRDPDEDYLRFGVNIGAQIAEFKERKHAQLRERQAVAAQKEVARTILENAPLGFARLDSNFNIVQANDVFATQVGVPAGRIVGRKLFSLNTAISKKQIMGVMRTKVPLVLSNLRKLNEGESPAYLDVVVWPVYEHDQDGLIVLSTDVTERMNLHQQREDFVATLTHDLKNPLIGQNRLLDLFIGGRVGELNPKQLDLLKLLQTGTKQMLQMISTVLEVYRYEAGLPQFSFEQINMATMLNDCFKQLSPIAESKQVNLSLDVADSPLFIVADETAVRRVVMNLVDNAIKFCDAGGNVKLIAVGVDDGITIKVSDDGVGIESAELVNLFERFSQTRVGRKYKVGTGLGLYLCREIVQAHAGTISCESETGKGAVFTVFLPHDPRTSRNFPV